MATPLEQAPRAGPQAQASAAAAVPPASSAAPRRPVRRRAVTGPPPSAEATLAARAAEIQRSGGAPVPARWLLPGFARDVDLVRRHLAPLRDRRMLVASYERESARLAVLRRLASDPSSPPPPLDPLEAAYAVRWLELADGAETCRLDLPGDGSRSAPADSTPAP